MENATAAAASKERRISARFEFAGEAELVWEGSDPVVADVKNISVNGCFLKTGTSIPLDTPVRVKLRIGTIALEMDAVVRRSLDGHGVGLEFSTANPILTG